VKKKETLIPLASITEAGKRTAKHGLKKVIESRVDCQKAENAFRDIKKVEDLPSGKQAIY